MRYTYIKLVNYKYFPLMETELFEQDLSSKLIMIVGPNGAGKSSLLAELSPLPADKNNFYKNGYKEVRLDKDKDTYTLISDFTTGSGKFSFIKNEEELNISGNVTTQRDLAAMLFGITPVIHEILTGGECFTDMALPSRKKLFNSLTQLNIDSIIESYDKLREELKNNEYLIKTLNSRLLTEKEKLLTDDKRKAMSDYVEQTRSHIDTLLGLRTELHHLKNAKHLDAAMETFKSISSKVKQIYTKNYVLLTAYPYGNLQEISDGYKAELACLNANLKHMYKVLEELDLERRSIESVKDYDLSQVQLQVQELQQASERISKGMKYLPEQVENIDAVINDLNLLERALPEILESLPANPDRRLSKVNMAKLSDSKNEKLTTLTTLLKEHSAMFSELRELQTHKSLNCPNCHHTWLPEELNSRILSLQERLPVNDAQRAKLEAEVKELSVGIEEQRSYLEHLSLLINLYTATKHNLKPIWDHIFQSDALATDPSHISFVVSDCLLECRWRTQLLDNRAKIKHLETLMQSKIAFSQVSAEQIAARISKVERAVLVMRDDIDSVQVKLTDAMHAKTIYTTLTQLDKQLISSKTDLHSSITKHSIDSVISEIDKDLSLSRIEVIEAEKKLGANSSIEASVKLIQEQIDDAIENKKVLTILTDELSPKTGLIAKTVSNFLNIFIRSIDSVISSVWDYSMTLVPIDLDNDPLNYKFKVLVQDKLVVDDISKVSSGMKEVINLAMKITLYKLLKLDGYPMKLDEFGVKLDSVHRSRIADVIFKMLNSPQFSQIFLITHLDLAYSNFKDTQVIEF